VFYMCSSDKYFKIYIVWRAVLTIKRPIARNEEPTIVHFANQQIRNHHISHRESGRPTIIGQRSTQPPHHS
ncbi:MAG TPA: hypothetical protein PKC69_14765, partial [Chitinophagaceae bacterium]|nr:hypothetical protein [Chitinophagaceae bacterium]